MPKDVPRQRRRWALQAGRPTLRCHRVSCPPLRLAQYLPDPCAAHRTQCSLVCTAQAHQNLSRILTTQLPTACRCAISPAQRTAALLHNYQYWCRRRARGRRLWQWAMPCHAGQLSELSTASTCAVYQGPQPRTDATRTVQFMFVCSANAERRDVSSTEWPTWHS